MKKRSKIFIIAIILFTFFLLLGAKWWEYTTLESGNIADSDTFLINDVSDVTGDPNGTNKQFTWSSIKTAILTYFKTSITYTKSFSLPPKLDTTYTTWNFLLWRTAHSITIQRISVICQGGNSTNYVVGGLDYTDSDGSSNLVAVDSDITANGGLDHDDGSLSHPTVASGKWLKWHTTSVTGSPSGWTTVSIDFKIN